jgi:hypothetical protein
LRRWRRIASALLLRTEAVAQRNSGVRWSQSRLETILTDVLYGRLGAFDSFAGLI